MRQLTLDNHQCFFLHSLWGQSFAHLHFMLERHNSCSSIHQGLVEEMMNTTLTPGLRLFLSVTCTSLVVLGHRRMTCSVSRRSWLSYALWKCHKLWITGKKLTKTSSVGCLLLSFDITTRIILSSSFLSLVALENNLIGPYPITSWEIDGETVERVSDFILGGSKVTADGDCSHEIKRHFLLGRKVMTNLNSIFKSRDIILPTKVHLVKAMVFPVVMYGCESWTVKNLSAKELMLLNCGVGEDSWESLGLQGDLTSPFWRRSVLGLHWKEWC